MVQRMNLTHSYQNEAYSSFSPLFPFRKYETKSLSTPQININQPQVFPLLFYYFPNLSQLKIPNPHFLLYCMNFYRYFSTQVSCFQLCKIYIQRMQIENKTYDIAGNQFPFGVLDAVSHSNKIFLKKRYTYRSQEEYHQLMMKVEKLKGISHKNTINLRSITEGPNYVDTYYQAVPLSLEDFFSETNSQTIKEMHRQFIELAIYLAKKFIITTFSAARCGVVTNESRNLLKYYIPLNEITITDNRNLLERSVQLFNVQSMHYLDTLLNQSSNSALNESFSQTTFKNRVKLFPSKEPKQRRDSQPSAMHSRKLSNNPTKQSQIRKLSSLSRELSQISKMHNRRGESTRVSGESFKTIHSIPSFKSGPQNSSGEGNMVLFRSQQTLKRCLSQKGIQHARCIDNIISRSRRALDSLHHLREKMSNYKGFFNTLTKLKKQY